MFLVSIKLFIFIGTTHDFSLRLRWRAVFYDYLIDKNVENFVTLSTHLHHYSAAYDLFIEHKDEKKSWTNDRNLFYHTTEKD